MKINQDTFCTAPWFQIRNRQDMTKNVCCLVEMRTEDPGTESLAPLQYLNSDKVIKMREQMANGIRVPQCAECWIKEKSGTQSYRQQINSSLKGPWLDLYFKQKKNFETDMVLMSDIKIGNTCNFSCVMCNPSDSSMIYNNWVKDKDNEFVKEYIDQDKDYFEKAKRNGFKQTTYREYIDNVINNEGITYIKLVGGEPLLDHKLIKMLCELPMDRKQKMNLEIVTNGSHDLVEHTNKLGNFKHIQWNISLEGTHSAQDYSRYGSNWDNIEKNILSLKKITNNICIATCLQATSITKLHQLITWTKKHNVAFSLNLLETPEYLTMDSVPDKLKEQIVDRLREIGNYNVLENNEIKSVDINSSIDLINNSTYNKNLHKKFKKFIKFYEQGKILPNFLDVFEEWRPYFEI